MILLRLATGLVLLLAVCDRPPAAAVDAAATLLDLMKERDRTIQEIVGSDTRGETEEDRQRLKHLVGGMFDFRRYSELALGRYWDDRTEAEKAEFTDLCRQLIEKNYADPKLYTKSDRIDYISSEVDGNEGVVRTLVHYRSEQSTIDYLLHFEGGDWLIYDMAIDDLSVAANNRSQFRKEIRKTSYEGLVRKLKDNLAEQAGDDHDGE